MIFVEHIKDDVDHLDGNAALIASFLLAEKNDKHYFFAGESHFNKLKELLITKAKLGDNLNWIKIKPFNNFMREYKLILSDLKIALKVFHFAKKNKIDKIVFLYTTTFLLYYVKFLLPFYPNIKVFCMIHGELEKIDFNKYAQTFKQNKTIMFLYALFLGLYIPLNIKTSRRLKYLVYGESIKENAIKIIPSLKDYIIAIPHPVLWETNIPRHEQNNKTIIAIPGILAPRKNQQYLQQLFSDISKNKDLHEKCLFKFSGRILAKDFYDKFLNSEFIDKSTFSPERLSFEQRNRSISACDYTLYTYFNDSYKLIASGAFIDSINFEKPVIAIKNNYIEYYFNKYGDIGYLCNSYNELKETVFDIIKNNNIDKYNIQIQNIQKIKKEENIYQISKILQKEL